MDDAFTIAGRSFRSRLITGTGKYDSYATMREAALASGCEMVTVAVRRIDLDAVGDEDITHFLPDDVFLLPNTAGCETAEALVEEGFTVLPYVLPDPVLAKRLEAAGCATVMPLAAPIGSGRGLKLRDAIRIMVEQVEVPVVVDAGRAAHLAGIMAERETAEPSSSVSGLVTQP